MAENKEENSGQGKQSTAETDVTYNRDDESLRNSATTSMGAASDPESDQVAGGDRSDDLVSGITDDNETDTDTNS
ncbi:hypothetical protein [Adhaeribacter radiodurans]|uniref:Uncharacterized protein n=1 Tax=Adhaeribacter radiodurans TaxID=2745197 RepID=A0A7L7LAR5_9BACT|nr:hypothetical protein [Adhaeribacter radiodurans]QMU29645.1 hypothetical protein HUW48_17125 [Adhaeribacter radiodurans]